MAATGVAFRSASTMTTLIRRRLSAWPWAALAATSTSEARNSERGMGFILAPRAGRCQCVSTPQFPAYFRIRSEARSAIATTAACALPATVVGMTDASTTRRPVMPTTRSRESTTAAASLPIRQVPTGW